MRRLILMRHADAEDWTRDGSGADVDRRLTPRGRRDAEAAGVLLARRSELPRLALVSTALRARDTWAAMCVGMGGTAEVWFDRTLYDGGAPVVVELVAAVAPEVQSVIVVGHNPAMSVAAAAFSDGAAPSDLEGLLASGMPTAAMAFFDVPGQWEDVNARRLRLTAVEVAGG